MSIVFALVAILYENFNYGRGRDVVFDGHFVQLSETT